METSNLYRNNLSDASTALIFIEINQQIINLSRHDREALQHRTGTRTAALCLRRGRSRPSPSPSVPLYQRAFGRNHDWSELLNDRSKAHMLWHHSQGFRHYFLLAIVAMTIGY